MLIITDGWCSTTTEFLSAFVSPLLCVTQVSRPSWTWTAWWCQVWAALAAMRQPWQSSWACWRLMLTWVSRGTLRTYTGLSRGLSQAPVPFSCHLPRMWMFSSVTDRWSARAHLNPLDSYQRPQDLRMPDRLSPSELLWLWLHWWFSPEWKRPWNLWWFSVFLSDTSAFSEGLKNRLSTAELCEWPMSGGESDSCHVQCC